MPTLAARFTEAVKAFRYGRTGSGWEPAPVTRLGPLTSGGVVFNATNYTLGLAGRDEFDPARSAGAPGDNSVVAICLGKIGNVLGEPALQVEERQADGTWEPVEDHPLLTLLSAPNQIDDLNSLVRAWAYSYKVAGEAFFVASYARGGAVVQVDLARPDTIKPVSENPEVAIEYYVRRVDGQDIRYDAPGMPRRYEGVVWHWRDEKDSQDPRRGCSRLKKLLTELASDNEASLYTAAILHNMGVVGGILTNEKPDEWELTEEKANKLKSLWRAMVTGGNRGGLLVPTFPAKFTDAGRSPEEMALDVIRQIPQARIAAALDVPLQVAQLPCKDVSGSYANYSEARESFWEECIIPLQTRFTDGLTRYALPLFGDAIAGPSRRRVAYNYKEVRALQPDKAKESTTAVAEWQADGITLNEFREATGRKALPDAEGKVYFSEHSGGMKAKNLPPVPDSPGDAMASGRTPPFGARAGLNGKAVKVGAEAARIKAELGAVWRERRRQAEEEDEKPTAKFNPNHDPHSGRFASAGGAGGGAVASGEGIAAAGATMEVRKYPSESLVLREQKQNARLIKEYTAEFRSDPEAYQYMPPITLVRTEKGAEVIDGHHRAIAAQKAGSPIRGVEIPEAAYQKLQKREFDDIEISAGMLHHVGEHEAADRLESQFSGANVAKRSEEVWNLLDGTTAEN